MRTRSVALAIAIVFCAAPGAAQVDVCSSRKISAGAAYIQARANCLGKALAKGVEPDSLCIAKALTKLQKGFEKAEAKGSCTSLADLAPAEDVLADALDDGFDAVATNEVVCCDESTTICTYRSDALDCTDGGGTPGLPGSVCQGDGTCGPISQQLGGPCCEGVDAAKPSIEGACATGPALAGICIDLSLSFFPDRWCHPGVGCVNASEPARTKCTSAQVKAIGKHVAAVLRCNAKAIQKSLPVDLVCLGKAESKLVKAFAAARKRGDCMAESTDGPVLTVGNDAAALVVKILHPETRFCCELALGCFYTETGPECSGLGGQPVGTGECDADGTCKAPPLEEGGCCSGVPNLGAIDRCIGGTTQIECDNLSGEYVDDALCLAAQVCID
jgi:hypothetical protein